MTTTSATQAPAPGRATARRGRSDGVLLMTTRLLLALYGTLKLVATVWFTFFASAAAGGDPQGLGDWSVAVWSIGMGVGWLFLAAQLGRPGRSVLPLAVAVSVADLAFSVVKLLVYSEQPAVGFMAITLALLALVTLTARRRANA